MRKTISIILLVFWLVGCAPRPPTGPIVRDAPTLPTVTPAAMDTSFYAELEPISPANVAQLELLDRWGRGFVSDLDISPDGTLLVVSTSTGLYAYDTHAWQERAFTDNFIDDWIPMSYGQKPVAVAFSPNGKYLAIAGDLYGQIGIWNLQKDRTESVFYNLMSDYSITHVAFSQDSQQVIVTSNGFSDLCEGYGGVFQLYDVQRGDMLYYQHFCDEALAYSFRVVSDGRVFFTGYDPSMSDPALVTRIVEASTGSVLETILDDPYDSYGTLVDVSADGSVVAVQTCRNGKSLTDLINFKTSGLINSIEGDVLFMPETDYFLAKDWKSRAPWELKDYDDRTICTYVDDGVRLLLDTLSRSHFIVRGDYLATWSSWNQEIQIWNTTDCRLIHRIPFFSAESRPEFSPDGKTIATNYVHLWDTGSGRVRFSVFNEGKVYPRPLAFDPTGTQVVVGTGEDPYKLMFFDTRTGGCLQVQEGYGSYLYEIVMSPDGSRMATLDSGGLYLWDTGQAIMDFAPDLFGGTNFTDIAFSPDGSELIVALRDPGVGGEIAFLDVASGGILSEIELSDYTDVVFSPDWEHFATSCGSGRIKLWDLAKGIVLHNLVGHQLLEAESSYLSDLTFSPDGSILASVKGGRVRLWDVQTGALLAEMAPRFDVHSLAFSPDGRTIATTGRDGTIRIWGVRP